MAYNVKTGKTVPDEKPGDFATYANPQAGNFSVVAPTTQTGIDNFNKGTFSFGGQTQQYDPSIINGLQDQIKKNTQAIVNSQSAKADVSKIQSDFQTTLSSLQNKQQYNQMGLNATNSVVDLMKSKGIADTSQQARQQLAQQAGIADYNPANAESNKKLADAIMSSKAVGSAMSEMTPGTPAYDSALTKVTDAVSNASTKGNIQGTTTTPTTPAEPLTSMGTKVSEDPQTAEYDKTTKQIDDNNIAITASLNQLKTGAIPLTSDQQAIVDQTQRSFDNAINQQKTANQAQENIARQAAFRSGSEYTPEVSSSIIKNVIDANVLKISEYDLKALAAVTKLKQDFKDSNFKAVKETYDLLQSTLKDKQSNMLSLMKLSHDYEKETLNHSLDTLKYNETMRHNKADEANATYKAESKNAGLNVTGPYANVINTILGSGKFTETQSKLIVSGINNGEDPLVVIKNQARGLLSGGGQTRVEKSEESLGILKELDTQIKQYYAGGGDTGILTGNYEKAMQKIGQTSNPELAGLGAAIATNLQAYRNSISGTAYSDQEGKDINAIFPGITKGEILNNALVKAKIKGLNSSIDSAYVSVLGEKIYNDLKANKQAQEDAKAATVKLDLQSVMSGVKAETDAAVTAGTMTAQEASDKVYKAVKDARSHNESLSNVGGDTNQASVESLKNKVAKVETGGRSDPYTTRSDKPTKREGGRLDYAYGKYQVMGDNIPSWTKEALGKSMTIEEFKNSPEAQEKVATLKLGQYLKKHGNEKDAASVWFTGQPLAMGKNRKDSNGTTGQQYVNNVMRG